MAPTFGGLRGQRLYLLVVALLVVAYAVTLAVSWPNRSVDPNGPLTPGAPAVSADLAGAAPLTEIRAACLRQDAVLDSGEHNASTVRVVTGVVRGQRLFGCFGFHADNPEKVWGAAVLDARGKVETEVGLVQASGAWPWIGLVKKPYEVALGGLALAVIGYLFWRYYRARPPEPPIDPPRRVVARLLMMVPVIGYLIGAFIMRRDWVRYLFQNTVFWCWIGVLGVLLLWSTGPQDRIGLGVILFLLAGLVWGTVGGMVLVRTELLALAPAAAPTLASAWAPPAMPPAPAPPPPSSSVSPSVSSSPIAEGRPGGVRVRPPGALPTFADVGGMDGLKATLEETFGLLLAYSSEADAYRIEFNGILLHGPPGVGKTFIASAVAGEYGMSFAHVTTGDLVSSYVGEAARNLEAAFATAAANLPCVLFFDEFDSIAPRREDQPNQESTRLVNQLLTSLEKFRGIDELVVMAATNHLDTLDPAVVRPGRFDRQVRIDLPDAAARKAIFDVQLAGRPTSEVDLTTLVRRTDQLTPAAIEAVVEAAALSALQESISTGQQVRIGTTHLIAALASRGGKDRPDLTGHGWHDVVLDDAVKAELQQIQRMIENPDLAEAYGIKPPSGLLLTGPPGTGKTTLARVMAAQTRCSFYSASPADLTSKWVGESENLIKRLFERARNHAPSIIFLDEVDAIAATRGELGSSGVDNSMLTQLLTQLDGLVARGRVFVMAATNRPEAIDPALLRPGRLSRIVEIPLPQEDGRLALLRRYTAPMTLVGVDLEELARRTDGWSGADLEGLVQQAAVRAMMTADADDRPHLSVNDFEEALTTLTEARERLAAARADNPSLTRTLNSLREKDF